MVVPPTRHPDLELVRLDLRPVWDPRHSGLERLGPIMHTISEALQPVAAVLFILFRRNRPRGKDVEDPRLRLLQVGLVKLEKANVHFLRVNADVDNGLHRLIQVPCLFSCIRHRKIHESIRKSLWLSSSA